MKLRVNNYPFNNRERLPDFLGVVYNFRKLCEQILKLSQI